MLGAIFVASGARALANPDPLVPKAKRVTDRVAPLLEKADPRLPTDARTLVQLNGAAQLGGGLLLATGRLTRPAAAVLAGTLIPTTVAGHPFWTFDDPAERRGQQIHFLKNLGLLGGLLLAAADTAGQAEPAPGGPATRSTGRHRRSACSGASAPRVPPGGRPGSPCGRPPSAGACLPADCAGPRSKHANHLNRSRALTRWKCREPVWDRTRSGNARGGARSGRSRLRSRTWTGKHEPGTGVATPCRRPSEDGRPPRPGQQCAHGIDRRRSYGSASSPAPVCAALARHRRVRAAVRLLRHEDLPRRGGAGGRAAASCTTFVAPDTTLGFTYPPFAAPADAADGRLSIGDRRLGQRAGQPRRARRRAAPRCSARSPTATAGRAGSRSALAVPLAAAIEPVRETLGFGQVNLLLFAPDHGRPGRAALARAGPWPGRTAAGGALRPVPASAAPGPASASASPRRSS